VLTVPPHGKLKYYTVGVHKEEEPKVDFQVSVYFNEEELTSPRDDRSPRAGSAATAPNKSSPPVLSASLRGTAANSAVKLSKHVEEPLIRLDDDDTIASDDEDVKTAADNLSDEEDTGEDLFNRNGTEESLSASTFVQLDEEVFEEEDDEVELNRYTEKSGLLTPYSSGSSKSSSPASTPPVSGTSLISNSDLSNGRNKTTVTLGYESLIKSFH